MKMNIKTIALAMTLASGSAMAIDMSATTDTADGAAFATEFTATATGLPATCIVTGLTNADAMNLGASGEGAEAAVAATLDVTANFDGAKVSFVATSAETAVENLKAASAEKKATWAVASGSDSKVLSDTAVEFPLTAIDTKQEFSISASVKDLKQTDIKPTVDGDAGIATTSNTITIKCNDNVAG